MIFNSLFNPRRYKEDQSENAMRMRETKEIIDNCKQNEKGDFCEFVLARNETQFLNKNYLNNLVILREDLYNKIDSFWLMTDKQKIKAKEIAKTKFDEILMKHKDIKIDKHKDYEKFYLDLEILTNEIKAPFLEEQIKFLISNFGQFTNVISIFGILLMLLLFFSIKKRMKKDR